VNQQFLNEVLQKAIEAGASDIHIGVGSPIRVRLDGTLRPLGYPPLRPADTLALALHVLQQAGRVTAASVAEYARTIRDEDCAYSAPGIGRFRVNICAQRSSMALVLRIIPHVIPTIDSLGLPEVVSEIALEERGLVLVTGITGSGKSTTLASMIGYINSQRSCKIVTIEDPIEFVYRDQQASIMQREVGSDTASFANAMRAALRQDPDVILVGEMRDRETIDIALKAAETGHLVLSTLHTTDAAKTLNRILSVFDLSEQGVLRLRLGDALRAIISQRLLPRASGKGRVPAIEVLRNTTTIKDCIQDEAKTHGIVDYIKAGRDQYGMQTFDQHLMALYEQGVISVEVAKAASTCPGDFERSLLYV
jgi:twitching motility protein PilT